MAFSLWSSVLLLAVAGGVVNGHDGQSDSVSTQLDLSSQSLAKERRYLLYDVNHGEGFNLRRDVYIRVASLVRQLRQPGGHNFILVLPPWAGLYHWGQNEMDQGGPLPWSLFFDLTSLGRYVPVIELEQFVKETGNSEIEQVLYLQRYAEGWTDGKFEEKWDVRDCLEADRYYYLEEGTQRWRGWFWSLEKDIWAKNFKCISVQGQSSTLVPLVLHENFTQMGSIMVDRAEAILHDYFGGVDYWNGRRSMRFSKRLTSIGDEFRRDQLNSNDEDDNTVLEEDWRKTQVENLVPRMEKFQKI